MARRIHNERTFRRGNIAGAEKAEQRLAALGEDVLFAVKIALAEAVENIVFDAKRRCPVKTGKLRDSIKAVDLGNGNAYALGADAHNEKGIAYGQFLEFSPRISKPFIYPAIRANLRKLKRDLKFAMQDAISQRGIYGNRAA